MQQLAIDFSRKPKTEFEYYTEMLIDMGVPEQTAIKFLEYHYSRPELYELFERKTLSEIEKGVLITGAKSIAEDIRRKVDIDYVGEFKICNTWVAYYGRLFAINHPGHAKVFVYKKIKGVKENIL